MGSDDSGHAARRVAALRPPSWRAVAALAALMLIVGFRPAQLRARSRAPVAAAAGGSTIPSCISHELAGAPAAERYLLYSPQFGLSNQLVALRNAVVWAVILNRTLVLPHLLGHAAATPRAAHGLVFATASREALAPLRVIEIDAFMRSGRRPARLVAFKTRTKYSVASRAYLEELGLLGANSGAAELDVSMPSFSTDAIREAFGGCTAPTLGFVSLFGAHEASGPRGYPTPGLRWLHRRAMPALLAPAPALRELVGHIESTLLGAARGVEGAAAPAALAPAVLGCVHVRRGDFVAECAKYDAEMRTGEPRPWVASHMKKGWSCLQSDEDVAANLRAMQRRSDAAPLTLYASVEDGAVLSAPILRPYNLSSLARFSEELASIAALGVPPSILSVLVDQLVCSRARSLLLNAFSTFSQMVMGHIGMAHPAQIGWTRDLTARQQKQLGVEVHFLQRLDVPSPRSWAAARSHFA